MIKKMFEAIIGLVVIAFLFNLLVTALGPFLHVIGATLAFAIILGIIGGIGFVGYRFYQYYQGGRGGGGM